MKLYNWLTYTTPVSIYIVYKGYGRMETVNIPNRLLQILPLTKAEIYITKYLKKKLNINFDNYNSMLTYKRIRITKFNSIYIITSMQYERKNELS